MEIIVNDTPIRVFKGAKVHHALLKYFSMNLMDKSLSDNMEVFDAYGHLIDLDAPLTDGQSITFEESTPSTEEEKEEKEEA
ncbi:MAG: hypothetical protein IKX36_08880 [Prevotella sp.]|nr:hypothetical protein [Prevotella sp.]